MRARRIDFIILAGLLAILGVFLLLPIWYSVHGALHDSKGWTLFHILDVFRDPQLRLGLWNALAIGLLTTLIATIVSIPMAMVSARCAFAGKGFLNALLLARLASKRSSGGREASMPF